MTTAYLRKKSDVENLREMIENYERRPDNQNRYIEKEVDIRLNQKQKELIITIEERDREIQKLDEYNQNLFQNVSDLQDTLKETRLQLNNARK